MKDMKLRLLSLLLSCLLLFGFLTACSGGDDTTALTTPDGTTAPMPEESTEAPEDPELPFEEIFDESVTGTNFTTSIRAASSSALYYYNKLYKNGPFAGDPFLFYDEGTFYLYGTTRKYVKPGSIVEEFEVYTSKDLVHWEDSGACFVPENGDWCTDRLWAPEVMKIDGKYYMYYTAAKGSSGVLHGSVAVSDSPLGPFTNKVAEGVDGSKPVFDFGGNFPTIDGSLFIDDDGKMYYFFVRDQIGDNASSGGSNKTTRSTLWGIEMENPYTLKEGASPVKLTEVGRSTLEEKGAYTQKWETQQGMWNEGPFVIKHGGKCYLTYSANYFGSKYYAVGYATSDSPLGTYTKDQNQPIMGIDPSYNANWSYFDGTGHAMFLPIGEKLYVVYHTLMPQKDGFRHFTIDEVGFREDGTLYINGPTVSSQNLPFAVSGVLNVADKTMVFSEGMTGLGYLTDGQVCASEKYKDFEAVTENGLTTVTFRFETPQDIIGVMVYNSADYEKSFTAVKNITVGKHYSFDNVKVLIDSYDKGKKAIYAGSCAILELNKAVSVTSVTVTFESDAPISVSEIKILAKVVE